jgi:hypothetical protein
MRAAITMRHSTRCFTASKPIAPRAMASRTAAATWFSSFSEMSPEFAEGLLDACERPRAIVYRTGARWK